MLWKIVALISLSIISAIPLSLSFSTYNLSFLAWVGLVPLFFSIHGKDFRQTFLASYLYGLTFFLFSMYWLIHVTILGWIILSLYQALYFAIFGIILNRLFFSVNHTPATNPTKVNGPTSHVPHSTPYVTYLIVPCLWSILEYLRSHIMGGLGWNLLGYSQYKNIPIIQIADITGAYGVSFLIVLVNLTVFLGIKMAIKRQKAHKPLFQTFIVVLIVVTVLCYGHKRIKDLSSSTGDVGRKLKVSVVQGNIPQLQKWDRYYTEVILHRYERLTYEAAKDDPDLIIWPETAIPGYPNINEVLSMRIQTLTRNTHTYLLAGAPTAREYDRDLPGYYNTALLFSKEGRLLQQYKKLHLVAFGEFIPFESHIPWLRKFLPLTGAFISGNEYTLFKLSTLNPQLSTNFGVLICFEDIFSDMVRRFVKDGADFMVNMTNDAWFGRSSAAYQHAANSVFRAIENRRPFVRSANTGLSCFIDRLGVIYAKVSYIGRDLNIDGNKTDMIALGADPVLTFYTRFGDIFILGCSLILGVFLIDYLRRRGYNILLLFKQKKT